MRKTETVSYELKLYPNPTTDYLNIFMRHHGGNPLFTFRIDDAMGQQMAVSEEYVAEETFMISLEGYASGVYYLEVMQGGEVLEVQRFVVLYG